MLLLLFACLTGKAQGRKLVTLQRESISLAELFNVIQQQTGYTVFYDDKLLDDSERVRANFNATETDEVLKQALKGKPLQWTFNNQFIRLKKTDSLPSVTEKKQLQLHGRITDNQGDPLYKATVKVAGTGKITLTDKNGAYSLPVEILDGTLVVGYVGFATVEIPIHGQQMLNAQLQPENSNLDEVVVIGYGTAARRDLTGAVGKADVEAMQKAPVASFDQALAGRLAGVQVVSADGQPGAAASITVRGNSVSQDGSPLFVVDGFPIENMDVNSINPSDIASLEVLKDASSIAIYGARGANGVIIINTKRGAVGKPRVTYSYAPGFQRYVKKMDMMSPYEFVKLQLELDSVRSTPTTPVDFAKSLYLDPEHGITLDSYKNERGYDWQDLLMQTGSTQNHTLNLSAGTENTRYVLSGSFYDQKGVIINTGMKRYDGRFTLDQRLSDQLRVGVTANYSSSNKYGTIPTASFSGGVVQAMWQYRPTAGIGNQDLVNEMMDSLAMVDFYEGTTSSLGNYQVNPVIQAQNEYRKNINNTGMLNAFIEYTFAKNFRLKLSGGYNSTGLKTETFYNSQTQQGNVFKNRNGATPNPNGINGSINDQLNSNYLSENILNYKTKVGKHTIDALGGFTYQYAKNTGTGFRSNNIPQSSEYLRIKSIGGGVAASPYSGGSQWQIYSFLSRFNYIYSDRYLLTLTGRADGSSKFAKGNQWGFFPSGAFAWRFTEEPFLKGNGSILNDGKLRVSFGNVGNNRVGDFSYLAGIAGAGQFSYPFDNVYTRGTVPFSNGNADLTWETTTELDIGLNLSFFKDRLSIDADYYHKRIKNFLLLVQVPYLGGYSLTTNNSQYQNTGVVTNVGYELTVNATPIKKARFRWDANFNVSFNRGKIVEFYDGFESMLTQYNLPGGNAIPAWIAEVGGSISQFYGYRWGGVYQYADFDKRPNGTYALKTGVPTYSPNVQPGDPKYQDINGDGLVTTADQGTLGSPLPKHTGGFSNNFTYANISLNVFFQWSYGNKILNANKMAFESTGGFFPNSNQFASYANRWTPDNPTNDIPRARYNQRGDPGNGVPKVNSRYIEDGSFIRLKTISLAYNVPARFAKKLGMSVLSVSASAQNLFTLTGYSGVDPEVSTFRVQNPANAPGGTSGAGQTSGTGYTFVQPSSSYTALSGGLDYTAYPRALTISFGLTATF